MNWGKIRSTIEQFFHTYKNKIPFLSFFLIGMIFIHLGVTKYKKSVGLDDSLLRVLVSTKNLPEGHKLGRSDVDIIQIPSKHVPMGVLKPSDWEKIKEYGINRAVSKGEMLLWNSFNLHYNYQSFSSKIEQGYRAVSIPVDEISSVSSMIQSGDHVDLITTLEIPGETKPSTLTLLQNVSVLSVGEAKQNEKSQFGYSTVTLMILPDEANLITHSSKYGSLSLILRNPLDMKTSPELNIISDQDIVQSAFRNRLQTIRNLSSEIGSQQ